MALTSINSWGREITCILYRQMKCWFCFNNLNKPNARFQLIHSLCHTEYYIVCWPSQWTRYIDNGLGILKKRKEKSVCLEGKSKTMPDRSDSKCVWAISQLLNRKPWGMAGVSAPSTRGCRSKIVSSVLTACNNPSWSLKLSKQSLGERSLLPIASAAEGIGREV